MPGVGLSKRQKGEKAEEIYEMVIWELVFYFTFIQGRGVREKSPFLLFIKIQLSVHSLWINRYFLGFVFQLRLEQNGQAGV